MKRTIRQGVFESNSSSMHSFVILKDDAAPKKELNKDIYIDEDGTWSIWNHDLGFGRSPFMCLATFESKWRYCLAALCDHINDDTCVELKRIAFTYITGLTKIELPMTTDSKPILGAEDSDYNKVYGKTEEEIISFLSEMEKSYGVEIDYWENSDGTYWRYEIPFTGYAEDYGMLKRFLGKNNVSLEEFIVNPKYMVIVDGDEYCIFDDLKNSGIINKDIIEMEYPEDKDFEEEP